MQFHKFNKNLFRNLEGKAINPLKPPISGACRKCGFVGHLAFQCHNFSLVDKNFLDLSSTSSESEYETPLKNPEKKSDKKRKKKSKHKKKQKQDKKVKDKDRKRKKLSGLRKQKNK
ncbi:unnamed protein product [Dracunculus medinensis]|uniref:CCHC-type domain-containing protein n=1 Tax=Dracunculus medinensis TaxID=318479 RepID=A0A3P7T0L8_DRAME|nr:unnamed protein product [Dracunculus medinensis]